MPIFPNFTTSKKVAYALFLPSCLIMSVAQTPAAPTASSQPTNTKVTKDLGGNSQGVKSEMNSHAIPLRPVSSAQKQENREAAQAINKVPGIHIEGKDLQPPAEDPEIKGFHPIKRLMAPVIRLGKGTVQLQQQMMKLEGPMGALEPSMNSLATKLQNVSNRLGTLEKHLVSMDDHVIEVSKQMTGVRQDLSLMEADVEGLNGPLLSLLQPLTNVKGPLHEMNDVLADMKGMITMSLFAIIALTLGIVFGTPIAAIFIYQYRRKIFPYMKEQEFPTLSKRQC
ncbi:hypothetical protein KBI23_27910 [bacterium]|nr:hypothetical protein [bacterium]MBP9809600.1 hypothetical protein [bacterium]